MTGATSPATRHAQVLVVGAGPAGMAAAMAAATSGKRVIVLDDNQAPGGQIWRSGVGAQKNHDVHKERLRTAFLRSGVELLGGRRVVDAPRPGVLRIIAETYPEPAMESFTWDRLVLATGARERFLPFPGWTLPGVFGAGGLQALVRGGYAVKGKRVMVAGTGPLLLAVAVHLQQAGARIVSVVEQAKWGHIASFAIGLWKHPGKAWQGLRYRAALATIPQSLSHWLKTVEENESGLSVQLTDGRRTTTEQCDLLACGFHLVGNTELAMLLGCRVSHGQVVVDQDQQTSVANIFCAGEPTGIAGLDAALVQGKIAGLSAAGIARNKGLYSKRAKESAFAETLSRTFQLRPELRSLAAADTIVCRCEDVTFGRLQSHSSWTEAKLQTRCGMGPCQGRICGPAVETLFGWQITSVRPPLYPVLVQHLRSSESVTTLGAPTLEEIR